MRGHARDDQVIAIGCRFGNLLRADHAARTAFVFYHEGLFQGFSQAHRNQSAQRIGTAASSVGHHDFHCALWPESILGHGCTRSQKRDHACGHAQQACSTGAKIFRHDSENQRKAFQVQILQTKESMFIR